MDNPFSKKELIYTIYQEKSFSRAAQKLFIPQPSLSLMVKKIEEMVGLPLFDRTTKPIQLTEAGKEYIAAVEQIRHIESAFQNYVQATNDLEAGSLGIGSNQLLSSLVLPQYITTFKQRYPKINLTLLDANSTTLENAISAGQLDIIIDNHILPTEIFEREYLATERLLLAVPSVFPENADAADHRLTYRDIISQRHLDSSLSSVPLQIFSNTPFILMNRDNDTRKVTNAIFQETGFMPKVLLELDRLATLFSYVEQGMAASIVSDTLICHTKGIDSANILYYPLPSVLAQRDIFVSYKRNKYYSKAIARFIDELRDGFCK